MYPGSPGQQPHKASFQRLNFHQLFSILPLEQAFKTPDKVKMLVTFSPTIWYRLHNDFLGRSTVLDVVNDNEDDSSGKLQMADVGNYSGQFWCVSPGSASYF